MSIDIKEYGIYPLSGKVIVSLAAAAATTLYTVPTGRKAVIDHVDIIAGADAGASTVTIGRSTALTDFLDTQTLSNLDAAEDKVELRPIPSATPVKQKTYAAGVVIQINVTSGVGGVTNTAILWGYFAV